MKLLLSCADKKVSKEALDLHLRRTESLNSTRARKLAVLKQCALCCCFIKSLWRLRLTVEECCMLLDALIKIRQRGKFHKHVIVSLSYLFSGCSISMSRLVCSLSSKLNMFFIHAPLLKFYFC